MNDAEKKIATLLADNARDLAAIPNMKPRNLKKWMRAVARHGAIGARLRKIAALANQAARVVA